MSADIKTKFLLTALPDVPFDGWTQELMQRTTEKLSISDNKCAELFPKGALGLAVYFSHWATEETLRKLKKAGVDKMRMRDRITLGVRTRLEILAPYKLAVSSLMSFLSLPPRSFLLPKLVWQAADKLWWAAGDTSTDYNHYTKRLLLSGVMSSTMLYWLNDTSAEHRQTWDFLDRRIENVMTVGQAIGKLKKKAH